MVHEFTLLFELLVQLISYLKFILWSLFQKIIWRVESPSFFWSVQIQFFKKTSPEKMSLHFDDVLITTLSAVISYLYFRVINLDQKTALSSHVLIILHELQAHASSLKQVSFGCRGHARQSFENKLPVRALLPLSHVLGMIIGSDDCERTSELLFAMCIWLTRKKNDRVLIVADHGNRFNEFLRLNYNLYWASSSGNCTKKRTLLSNRAPVRCRLFFVTNNLSAWLSPPFMPSISDRVKFKDRSLQVWLSAIY